MYFAGWNGEKNIYAEENILSAIRYSNEREANIERRRIVKLEKWIATVIKVG